MGVTDYSVMTLHSEFLLLVLLTPSGLSLESTCEEFKDGVLCAPQDWTDVISVISDLDSEIQCQDECTKKDSCHFFTYATLQDGGSRCVLSKTCSHTRSCVETDHCVFSVSGPSLPEITEACCHQFQDHVACDPKHQIDEIFDINSDKECQEVCRETTGCNHWTLIGSSVCFLYTECGVLHSCNSCTSGKGYPPLDQCKETHTVNTLLLGGDTDTDEYSTSMEVITSTGVCTPKLPPIPLPRRGAAAVLIHSKLLHCGGEEIGYHGSCNSYGLGGDTVWREEPGMVRKRSVFSLSLVGQTIYAVGGDGDGGDTVESYTEEGGWRIEGEMRMDTWRYAHCTVVMESSLVVIGGYYGSSSPSSSVDVIDTNNVSAGWSSMESMKTKRLLHGCDVWTHGDNTGFVVAGGDSDSEYLVSVEFYSYSDHSWIQLGSLVTPRAWHSVTAVNGMLVVSGGADYDRFVTSVEYFNVLSGEWEVLTNLRQGRYGHSGVSVPAKLLDC